MPSADNQRQRILPLPPDVIAQIHSSKHITTLQGVILSLLENSLDAASTKVDITVDWKRGSCTIDDNGDGISPDEFAEDGGLGKMYCTSKPSLASTHLHGSHGIFLAELSSMSLLTISSTHSSNQQSASLTFHMAKCITRSLPESTQAHSTVPARPGTNIAVHDLFGNMPVRLKHRALATSAPSSDDTSWQDLKRGVVALLLAWPKPCSVKLRDATSASKVVNISGLHTYFAPELTSKSLRRLAGSKSSASTYDPTDVLPILFQSGFASPDSRSSWVPLSANTSAISLKGIICEDPVPTKQCQFLSLGVMPCGAADGHGEWYDCVNRIFANSGFGIEEDDGAPSSKKEDREHGRLARQTAKDKPRKGVDRYPMFCLQLQFKEMPGRFSDPSRLNEASLKVVEDILEAAVTAWLEAHHFRPRRKRAGRRRNEEQESPARAKRSWKNGTNSVPATPVVGTDAASASITTDSGRKNRVTDIFGRPVSRDTTQLCGDTEELKALSRMRSGRPHSGVQSLRQNLAMRSTTEDSRPCTADDAVTSQKRLRLQAPPIDAGQYSGLRSHKSSHHDSTTRSHPRLHVPQLSERHSDISSVPQPDAPSSEDFGSINSEDLTAIAHHLELAAGVEAEETIPWTDPSTGQVHRVSSRTGIVMPFAFESRTDSDRPTTRGQKVFLDAGSLSSAGRPLSLSRRGIMAAKYAILSRPETAPPSIPTSGFDSGGIADGTAKTPAETQGQQEKWLPGFLREWNNPVFALRKEPPIPTASHHGPGILLPTVDSTHHACHSHADGTNLHSTDKGIALSKNALKHARIIAQVDRKFILAVLPATVPSSSSSAGTFELSGPSQSDTLVLIDQHAASERVMLEDLLVDLCTPALAPKTQSEAALTINHAQTGVQTVPLESTLEFDIPSSEQAVLEKFKTWFLRWGIVYSLYAPPAPLQTAQKPLHPLAHAHVHGTDSESWTTPGKRNKKVQEARLKITHLPPCIVARCQKEPRLAIELPLFENQFMISKK
ncbi:DNA mismatch repair protein [Zymoseptoria brevis]|uniref:DNA mismatch repair protein n=1 Tax=Zymoseptoria brevis TaxID=1047168 RepID=A0A0F4GJB0_9PEZI|nr:DNA mismatch repair protein [Zymoseptoria brevis]